MREMREGMVNLSISPAVSRVILPNKSWRICLVQSRATPAATRLANTLPTHARMEQSTISPPYK